MLHNKNAESGGGLFFIILAVALLVIMYPGFFKANEKVDQNQSTIISAENNVSINSSINSTTVLVNTNLSENSCGAENFGYPNYDGTIKEGDKCNEVIFGKDQECVANPPKNYNGEIDLSTGQSNPIITCCETDGTCQWEST